MLILSDIELRNIIDKLAQFVARNGPDFEQMTKSKQEGNPKFQFLYGGEHFNYYQYKVTTEQTSKYFTKSFGLLPQMGVNLTGPVGIRSKNLVITKNYFTANNVRTLQITFVGHVNRLGSRGIPL